MAKFGIVVGIALFLIFGGCMVAGLALLALTRHRMKKFFQRERKEQ